MTRDQTEADALTALAREAAARADWTTALGRAADLRRLFPNEPAGYQIGATAARGLGRFDDARNILAGTTDRFATEVWPLIELVWTAKSRGDRLEAIRFVGELLNRFPHRPSGYQLGFLLATEVKRYAEAGEFAAAALLHFPAEPWPLANAAILAHARGEPAEAITLAAELRRRFPDHPVGYQTGAVAARAVRRFDESAALLVDAIQRFPDRPWPLFEAAYTARARGDIAAGINHAAALRRRFPDDEGGYRIGVRFLRQWGRFDDADAVTDTARARFPAQPWPAIEARKTALLRENRDAASRLATVVQPETAKLVTAAARAPAGKKTIIVLGMHRAGTSLCANLIQLLGVSLGGPLAAPGFDNPDGFFEHDGVVGCHQDLFQADNADWDTVRLVRPPVIGFWERDDVQAVRERLRRIISSQITGGGGIWAVKDPRTVCFLPLWQGILEEIGVRPVWILAVRDPVAVAASLSTRDGLPAEHAYLLWAEHYLAALRDLGPEIAGIIHYERWFSNPAAQLHELAAHIGGAPDAAVVAARAAIKPGLRHETGNAEGMDLARTIHAWLSKDRPDLTQLQNAAKVMLEQMAGLVSCPGNSPCEFPG